MQKKTEKIDLSFLMAVFNAQNDPYFWGPGIRDEYVIHYVKKGCGFFECEGKTYRLEEGQCFLIVPGTLINYYPDTSDPWEYAWVEFSGLEAKRLIKQSSLSAKNPITDKIDGDTVNLFKIAAEKFSLQTYADICLNMGYLYLILAYFIEKYPVQNNRKKADNIIVAVTEFIENNYRQQDLNIDYIARIFNINRTSLYRHFVRELGVTPKGYITEIRIGKAMLLIENTDYSIKNIAYSVGYLDQLYFSKVFKNRTGLSPKDYRNSIQ